MENTHSTTKTVLWIVGILVVLIAVSAYFMRDKGTSTDTTGTMGDGSAVACTADAKMCPDGSYVGRIPPNCQFAACPAATTTPTTGNNGTAYPADILK